MLSEVSADTELPKLESVPLKASCITAGGAPIQISLSAEKRFCARLPKCGDLLHTFLFLFSDFSYKTIWQHDQICP